MKRIAPLIFLTTLTVRLLAADALTERLQRGLFEEEANHNLDAAIKEYQVVISQSDEQRKLIATALFRLGECHRKLGQTNEAAAYYQRVLRDFSEQEPLVKLAATLARRPVEATPTGLPEGPAKSIFVQELEKRLATLKVESIGQQMEADRIEKLTVAQLLLTETGKNDALLPTLQQQLQMLLQKEASLQSAMAPGHPEVKALRDQMDRLKLQMERQREEIIQATQSRAKATHMQLVMLDKELSIELERAAARGLPPATAAIPSALPAGLTQAEAEELARVKSLAQNSPDLLNAIYKDGLTSLQFAAQSGYYEVASFLLGHGSSSNALNPSATPPLVTAAGRGHLRILELLLDKGADINASASGGPTALMKACEMGFQGVVEALLKRGAEVNRENLRQETALHFAAYKGHAAIVELLLKKGANTGAFFADNRSGLWREVASADEGATPLHLAVGRNNLPVTKLLLQAGAQVNATNRAGRTPLHLAAAKGDTNLCELLLERAASVNAQTADGATPLVAAMLNTREEAAAWLLRRGADVNLGPVRFNDGAGRVQYPVHVALGRSSVPLLQAVLAAKPVLEVRDQDRFTPLQTAVGYKYPEGFVEMIAAAGAKVDLVFPGGASLLHTEVLQGRPDAVLALLKAGANPNVVNAQGETPLSLAQAALERKAQPYPNQPVFPPSLPGVVPSRRSIPGQPTPGALGFPGQLSASPPDDKTVFSQIVSHLKAHGADEFLQRRGVISAVRGPGQRVIIFYRGTNDWNRFTLFEFLTAVYEKKGEDLAWPDLPRLTIHRLEGSKLKPMLINAARLLEDTNHCAEDVALEWGDEVEIPMADHPVHESWAGLNNPAFDVLRFCLRREVRFAVGGTNVALPLFPPLSNRYVSESLGNNTFRSPFFRLSATVLRQGSFRNLLRSSSDLSRVSVTRIDPATRQPRKMTFDLNAVALPDMSYSGNPPPVGWIHDLWLRDGDVIEVPDKP